MADRRLYAHDGMSARLLLVIGNDASHGITILQIGSRFPITCLVIIVGNSSVSCMTSRYGLRGIAEICTRLS